MDSTPVVLFDQVSRVFRRGEEEVHALDGVSFSLESGSMLALVGPSGCGKSTLLGLVAGVDRADSGRIILCGKDLTQARETDLLWLRRHAIGVVFQAFHLMPTLTVLENVTLPLALARRREPGRVEDLLERVGLADRAKHYPSQLSGGEQQRTAIARALVHRPKVLVADEPTGNLDSQRGSEIVALMDELRRAEGTAILLATHDLGVVRQAERTLLMRDGRLLDGAAS